MRDQRRGQRFLAELAGIGQDLPYSPALLRDLFSLTGESSMTSLEKIGQVISQDQSLTARILALANSAFYGLQGRVTSVPRAVTLLGLKEIRNLVLILAAQALVQRHGFPEGFDLRQYWEHQLSTAVCAKVLGKTLAADQRDLDLDILFTAGLLHDFGKLLTAMYRPDDWTTIDKLRRAERVAYVQAEELHWGLEHGLIGAMTLDSWNLPPELTEPVNWHHAPSLAPAFSLQPKLVCLADALHHRLDTPDMALSSAALEVLKEFGGDQDALLDALRATLQDERLGQLVSQLA